jgi:hypothetical protein
VLSLVVSLVNRYSVRPALSTRICPSDESAIATCVPIGAAATCVLVGAAVACELVGAAALLHAANNTASIANIPTAKKKRDFIYFFLCVMN